MTYLGKEAAAEDAADGDAGTVNSTSPAHKSSVKETVTTALPYVIGGLSVLAIVTLTVMLVRSRRGVRMLQEPEDESDDHEMEEEEK